MAIFEQEAFDAMSGFVETTDELFHRVNHDQTPDRGEDVSAVMENNPPEPTLMSALSSGTAE